MKHATLFAAAALVVLANAFALIHAARNRSGPAEAEITLTDYELNYYRSSDDSGVSLRLRWADPGTRYYEPDLTPEQAAAMVWLDRPKLEDLGFDCSTDPSDRNASTFYSRQSARVGFVALEYDGAAAQSWMAGRKPDFSRSAVSRLVAIDAGRDARALRGRHPDRSRVVIVPAIIRISLAPARRVQAGRRAALAQLGGYIQDIPSLIHVPRPYSDGFRALRQTFRESGRETPLYRVRLRYGSLLEPWVVGVEF